MGGSFELRVWVGGGGLIFGGAYTWRGLFSEFYGILSACGFLQNNEQLFMQEGVKKFDKLA